MGTMTKAGKMKTKYKQKTFDRQRIDKQIKDRQT